MSSEAKENSAVEAKPGTEATSAASGSSPPALAPAEGTGPKASPGVGAEAPAQGAGGAKESPAEATPAPYSATPNGQWPKSAVDRVAKLTARLREYEARGAGAPRPVDPQTGERFSPEQIEAMVQERAGLLAQQQTFNSRCNEVAKRGSSKFSDWSPRLEGLTRLVDSTDPRSVQNYNLFLETALETGEAEAIIHSLGADLNEASRILSLPPVKMALEVGKLGAKAGALEAAENPLEPVTRLPRPIKPVGSSAPASGVRPDDPERGAEIPMDQWMKSRELQAKERRIR